MPRTGSTVRFAGLSALVVCATLAWLRPAETHPGLSAAFAYPTSLTGVGHVVSSTFTIEWLDSDAPIATGTATIDWYYASEIPKTYVLGNIPENVAGVSIVEGLEEADPNNSYVWDVSNVPSGSYYIWSRVNEPPDEPILFKILSFSEGVLSVHHDGDPLYPAITMKTPINPYVIVDREIAVVYEAFDPDATGRVTVEAFYSERPDEMITLIEDAPAEERWEFDWDISELDEGDWGFRAHITDDRGFEFTAHSRWFFRVVHGLEPLDAGVSDVGPDAGSDTGAGPDAGLPDTGKHPPSSNQPGGCHCVSPSAFRLRPSPMWSLLFGVLLLTRRRTV